MLARIDNRIIQLISLQQHDRSRSDTFTISIQTLIVKGIMWHHNQMSLVYEHNTFKHNNYDNSTRNGDTKFSYNSLYL